MIYLLVNRLTNISKGPFILTLLIFSTKSEDGQKAVTVVSSKNWTCQTNQYTESQNLVTQGNKWAFRQTSVQPELTVTWLRTWQISAFPLRTNTSGIIVVNSPSWSFSVVCHHISFIPSPWSMWELTVSYLGKGRLQHLRKSPATGISPSLYVTKVASSHGALGQDLTGLSLSSSCLSPCKALFLANSSASQLALPAMREYCYPQLDEVQWCFQLSVGTPLDAKEQMWYSTRKSPLFLFDSLITRIDLYFKI